MAEAPVPPGVATDVTWADEALRLLARAGRILGGSLDYRTTLTGLARLVVPTVADLCVIHLLEPDGRVSQVEVAHARPEREAAFRDLLRRYPLESDSLPAPLAEVVRTRRGLLVAEQDEAHLQLLARDAAHLELLRQVRCHSYLLAPMVVHDRVLGVLMLGITDSSRMLDPADLSLAEELAGRAAVAVDHARLYEAERAARADVEARTAWLRQLLRGAAVGTWRWDATSDVSLADAATSQLFGLPATEWRRSASEFMAMVHPDDRPGLEATHAALFGDGTHFAVEYRIVRADGVVRWVADHGTVFRAPDGRVQAMAGVVFDVTDQRAAEARLTQQARALATLLERSPDIIERYDREYRCLYANATRERETGLAPATLVGRRIGEMGLPAELVEQWEAMLARVFAEAAPLEVELAFPGVHGPAVYEVRCVPEFDAQGGVDTVLTVSRNVTARQAAAERLRQVDRMTALGRLAGGMAHEMNNMMTAVIGFGELVLRGLGERHPLHGDVEEMVRAAERAAGITHQLLAYSRRQVLQTTTFDLGAMVTATAPLLERTLGGRGRLELRLASDPLPVRADQGQIEQALVHLVLNARDAIAPDGVVTLGTAVVRIDGPAAAPADGFTPPPGCYAAVEVRDSGRGMDAETLARAFEPFFTTKAVGQGTGLGLSMVYGTIKQSGGYVTLESEPGRGTRVRVHLPLFEAAAGDAVASVDGAERHAGVVLVVGGESVVRALLRRSFELHGFRVLDAPRPEAVLAAAEAAGEPVALAVCDLDAGSEGDETARWFAERVPALPLLCVSAAAAAELAQRELLPPGAAVLQKPFTPEGVITQARRLLEARRPR